MNEERDSSEDPAQDISGISGNGDSAAEVESSKLVKPGDMQNDEDVPGQESVPIVMKDIFVYADILARRNGFYGIRNQPAPDLRNPDVVFPGDVLTLADGRLVKVEPGETIWKIATTHYKRDFARLVIISRQYKHILNQLDDDDSEELRDQLQVKKEFMKRLATTPSMQNIYKETIQ